jgi:serine/threonine protein kinase/tetratricopeptide (TPR) repeat protein
MIGSKILHYQITEKLGEGGMGEVFLAEDERLHRRVALKFLNRSFREDREAHDRLVREARAASQLSHANIVSIHAIEETDDHLFIVMEYVEGRSLRDVIKTGEIDTDTALDYAGQILAGLASAHEKDLVHRDIKSDNIKVTDRGVVKVLDFGLARSAGTADDTRYGSSAGTPAYMAPEQVHGEKADRRSDMFSFGVVFYEMLAGRRPFRGQHESAVTYSIVNEDPDPITVTNPKLPSNLQPVIDKLLAKNPDERYQTAAEALSDVERAITGAAPARARRSKPRVSPVVTAVALVAVVAIAASYLFGNRGDEAASPAAPAERPKLVVLPFENLGAAEDEYFADGITEEVTTRLAKLNDLGVISRKSAMKYKDSTKSLKEIGEELDVDYALEGSIRWDKTGETSRVRINTQLIRVSDDTHLWADSFNRVYEQIFVLEAEIAEDVATALNVTILEPERAALAEAPTDNLEAYDYYLKGREVHDRAAAAEDFELATTLLEQAVKLDSTFSLAHALLARYYTNDYFNNRFADQPRLQQGLEAARGALRHNPDGPEGHVAMGYYHYYGSRDYENALAEFKLAEKTEPNDAAMLEAMGYVQRRQGNWDEALANLERALELDPASLDLYDNVILTALLMRRYREADRYVTMAIEMAPEFPPFRAYVALRMMLEPGDIEGALALVNRLEEESGSPMTAQMKLTLDMFTGNYGGILERLPDIETAARAYGDADTASYCLMKGLIYDLESGLETESDVAQAYYDSARVVWERQLAARPDDHTILTQLGLAYAGMRDKGKAYYYADRAAEVMPLSRDAVDGSNMLENKAIIKGLFGDAEEALDILELLLDIPSMVTPGMLKANPLFAPLRENPRFQKMIREKQRTADNLP